MLIPIEQPQVKTDPKTVEAYADMINPFWRQKLANKPESKLIPNMPISEDDRVLSKMPAFMQKEIEESL